MANFGSTFQPSDQNLPPWMRGQQQGQSGAAGGGFQATNPVQQAVQILSLRLPEVFGSQAPISRKVAAGNYGGIHSGIEPSAVARSVVANATGQPPPPIPPPPPLQQAGGYHMPSMPNMPRVSLPGAPHMSLPSLPNMSNIPNMPNVGNIDLGALGRIIGQIQQGPPPNPLITMGNRPAGGGGFAGFGRF